MHFTTQHNYGKLLDKQYNIQPLEVYITTYLTIIQRLINAVTHLGYIKRSNKTPLALQYQILYSPSLIDANILLSLIKFNDIYKSILNNNTKKCIQQTIKPSKIL